MSDLEKELAKRLADLTLEVRVKKTQLEVTRSALTRARIGADPEEVMVVYTRDMRRAEGC